MPLANCLANSKIGSQIYITIKELSWIGLLLIFVPFGIISGALQWNATLTFILNFLAIIPLAKLLGNATEELALRTSQTIGGLLSATFGNAVELILGIVALKQGLIRVVQASMIGSILSNLLFVLGFSFLLGGVQFHEQKFNIEAAKTSGSLLLISVMSMIIPAAMNASVTDASASVLKLSRGTAVILLIAYILYLFFQLKTHTQYFADEEEEENREPTTSLWFSIAMLTIVTVLVAVNAEYLVGSIEIVSPSWNITETFIGIILLPIVGNAAEHLTSVTMAMKDKMNLTIGVAIGSSMQISLFVLPLMVIIGWGMNVEMTLFFHNFETATVFISILIVNSLISDGESNWLEGMMLLCTYVIIAIGFLFLPAQ